MTEPGTTARRP
uniref:ARP908 n=1 Tax=Arundo donax TaxID=35708 RepID=A0A0A9DTT9_ARUDO